MKIFIFKRKVLVPILFFVFFLSGCTKYSLSDFYKQKEVDDFSVPAGQVAVIESDIIVNEPLSGDLIVSPVKISGKIIIPSDKIHFRLFDGWDNLIATSSVLISQSTNEYSLKIDFPTAFTESGTLQAYLLSDDDKSERNLIKVPVKFKDYKKPVVTLFYSNILKDPNLENCNEVYALEKEIVIKNDLVSSVLSALFATLSEEEMKNGYVNNFPEAEIKINKIEYFEGTASLDFSSEILNGVNDKCRKQAIIAQISQTLKQFKDVENIKISVDGKDLK